MIYMPDLSLVMNRTELGNGKNIVLFDVYDLESCSKDDPYRTVLHNLDKAGLHRNMYLVDNNGLPIWRVADHEPATLDGFVYIDITDKDDDYIIGRTFQGFIYDISLSDGTLTKHGWEKR